MAMDSWFYPTNIEEALPKTPKDTTKYVLLVSAKLCIIIVQ